MKKLISICMVMILIFSISACGKDNQSQKENDTNLTNTENSEGTEEAVSSETDTHVHSFSEATCTTPKTCACGATEGDAAGHKFSDATCTTPKTCSVCNAIEGDAAGHKFSNATCTTPKTCSVCNATEGNVAAHSYSAGKCSVCGTADPASATLLLPGSYGTYSVYDTSDKEEGVLYHDTIIYNGNSDVTYITIGYEETSAEYSQMTYNGVHYAIFAEDTYTGKNITVTENSLFFEFDIPGVPSSFHLSFTYNGSALVKSNGVVFTKQ